MADPGDVAKISSKRLPAIRSLALGGMAGGALTTFFLRRQIAGFARRAMPYIRRPSTVQRPALIVNRWSGDGKAERYGLVDAAGDAGVTPIVLARGDDIVELARRAIDDGADAIGAAGGDGSLGLVAGVAIERDVPFFCVPVGTRNHFALDLGIDRDDPLAALDAIRDGDEIRIDCGMVGDRTFLNNVCFGVYADAVHREEYRENKELTIAQVISELATSGRTDGTTLRFVTPAGESAERTALTLVSNNPYVFSGPPDFGRRRRLDSGSLGIHTVATGETAAGTSTSGSRSWEASMFEVEADDRIVAAVDGEALTFDSPLGVRIRPQALRVLVPAGTKPGYITSREAVAANLMGLVVLGGLPGRPDAS